MVRIYIHVHYINFVADPISHPPRPFLVPTFRSTPVTRRRAQTDRERRTHCTRSFDTEMINAVGTVAGGGAGGEGGSDVMRPINGQVASESTNI